MQSTSIFADFLENQDYISNAEDIDNFREIISEVLEAASQKPSELSETFLESLDLVIARLTAQVLDYHFSEEGVVVFHSCLGDADKIAELIGNAENRSKFKWRWKMAFNVTDLYLQSLKHSEEVQDVIDLTSVKLDLQMWMSPNENGEMTVEREELFFHIER